MKVSYLQDYTKSRVTITRLHRQVEIVIESQGSGLHSCDQVLLCRTFNFYGPSIRSKNAFYAPGGSAKVSQFH